MEETQRQKKIAGIIQRDLADILQRAATDSGLRGVLISVSKVYVTVDLSLAKVYVSIFPNKEASQLLEEIKAVQVSIRHELAARTKHQLRRVPELNFYLDDSLGIHRPNRTILKGRGKILLRTGICWINERSPDFEFPVLHRQALFGLQKQSKRGQYHQLYYFSGNCYRFHVLVRGSFRLCRAQNVQSFLYQYV